MARAPVLPPPVIFSTKKHQALRIEVEDVLQSMPEKQTLTRDDTAVLSWWDRAGAAVAAWDPMKALDFDRTRRSVFSSPFPLDTGASIAEALMLLREAAHALRIRTTGPVSSVVMQGSTFEYFDELRQILATAAQDVFFIDPYLDAEFVARYCGQVRPGVTIRLLTRKSLASLIPAVQLFTQQHGALIQVRSAQALHDRHVLVDNSACFFSGASFKDGAKHAPTTLMQIVDAFDAVRAAYETKWSTAQVEL